MPGTTDNDVDTVIVDDEPSLKLLVAWHPLLGDRLLYAAAVEGETGMVLIVDGRAQVVLQAVDVVAHGMTGPISKLQWSPDRSRLAVHASEHVLVMI